MTSFYVRYPKALRQIGSQVFDVPLTDLHMPAAGDGLTVVSAMRHSHPHAATFILSGYPEMSAATSAILLQTDQVLLKPMTLQNNLQTVDFSLLLVDLMAIADEVDSQLAQAMTSYIAEANLNPLAG